MERNEKIKTAGKNLQEMTIDEFTSAYPDVDISGIPAGTTTVYGVDLETDPETGSAITPGIKDGPLYAHTPEGVTGGRAQNFYYASVDPGEVESYETVEAEPILASYYEQGAGDEKTGQVATVYKDPETGEEVGFTSKEGFNFNAHKYTDETTRQFLVDRGLVEEYQPIVTGKQ